MTTADRPEVSELHGYRRPDGRVGVRNHVVVLPVDEPFRLSR